MKLCQKAKESFIEEGILSMNTKIKIAVHVSQTMHQDSFAPRWMEFLTGKGIEVIPTDFRQTNIIDVVKGCHGAMWHWFHSPNDKQVAIKIISALEFNLGIRVFPNLPTCWHYDEKVSQHYLFDAISIPKVKSWVFWSYDEALGFLCNCTYPIIFKLSVGAGSANVLKVSSFEEGKKLLQNMFFRGFFPYTLNGYSNSSFNNMRQKLKKIWESAKFIIIGQYPSLPDYFLPQKNYLYLQEFIPDNSYDIRITVIGNRAFGFIRYNRPGDFRASGSGNISYDTSMIPIEAVKIAHSISKKCGFQSMAYDFLCTSDKRIVVNEISYCYVNTAVYNCPGYWDQELVWQKGNIWPEYAQAEDFLNSIRSSLGI